MDDLVDMVMMLVNALIAITVMLMKGAIELVSLLFRGK
jgi:hypothetical protein